MAQFNNRGVKTFNASQVMDVNLRVKRDPADSEGVLLADAGEDSIGTTEDEAENIGDPVTIRLWNHAGTRKVVAAGAFADSVDLYGAAAGKVDDAIVGDKLGEALAAASGDNSVIELLPANAGGGGLGGGSKLEGANLANSAAISNTAVETAFDVTQPIDGDDLSVGDVLEIQTQVQATATNGADTLNIRAKIGGEEIAATGAVDVANGDIGQISAYVTIEAVGVGGQIRGHGTTALGVPGTVTAKPFLKASAAEDLSGALPAITVTAQWNNADPGNSVRLENLQVIKHSH